MARRVLRAGSTDPVSLLSKFRTASGHSANIPDLSGRMPYTWRMASSPTTKTRRIEIRITEEERNLEQAAAAVSGETLSEFVRRAARHEAERTLAERTRYILDEEAAQRFLTALEQPSPNSERGCAASPRSQASYPRRDPAAQRGHLIRSQGTPRRSLQLRRGTSRPLADRLRRTKPAARCCRTFVTTEPDGKVAGDYTLVAAQSSASKRHPACAKDSATLPDTRRAPRTPRRHSQHEGAGSAVASCSTRFSASYAPQTTRHTRSHRRSAR